MSGRTKADFLEFLDWLGSKGLMPLNTAQARKAVANKVLAALEEEELSDITALDIDNVMLRFTNKFGKKYKPESQRTYRSRFETSVADFKAYCDNPVGFRPQGRPQIKRPISEQPNGGDKKKLVLRKPAVKTPPPQDHSVDTESPGSGNVIPIQIRHNLTVRIGPVPFDLTKSEATKIANIILAHATPID
ncbi:hypothetical protein GCM10009115_21120 [Sphingopyxis soli]|uniref:Core-binding (CB) domain-containing protein n=1 Tax=Sphingopyxis soli TaxID=592051 RepID=A0ABN1M6B6_9SPHN|nr:hypothetical protein [Sphingopyxis soli]